MDPEKTLKDLMAVGLLATNPYTATLQNLPKRPVGSLFILSIGKAAVPMAYAAAGFYKGKFDGILLAPEDYMSLVLPFKCFEGSHPLPSRENVQITKGIMEKVSSLKEGDMFLALISGGTSALLCSPLGVTLEEKIGLTDSLLKSGAGMEDINASRIKFSAVKGGKLGEMAHPADIETLLISDVAGDNPKTIGSGPTGGGKIILRADDMLTAVEEAALEQGISVSNLGGAVTGEARRVAADHADMALGYYGKRPHLILSGGETSVTVTGSGQGGRNSEYALALAMGLDGAERIHGLSIDTDGIDGTGPHAGAWARPETLAKGVVADQNAEKSLNNNDSANYLKAINGLINTDPTRTNLNDLRMILMV